MDEIKKKLNSTLFIQKLKSSRELKLFNIAIAGI